VANASLKVLVVVGWVLSGSLWTQSAAQTRSGASDHPPVDAVQGITSAFEKHPVVMIAEWRHGLRQMGDFLNMLVADKRFQAIKPEIVVEFASRNNQTLLDRYIAGDDLPVDAVRHIWRDTTKVASWEFPVYANWLAAIRSANQKLPAAKRFHVLAGDTPIDWSKINTHVDWAALGDNNISFAEVVKEQVLKKKLRAFVVLGGNHAGKMGTRDGGSNATTLIEDYYPGAVYTILHYMDPKSIPEARLRLVDSTVATVYDLKGTSFGESPDSNGVAPVKYTDALLYLGPVESMVESKPPDGSLEPEYMKELDRRSMIEWGELRARKFLGAAAK